MTAVNRYYSSTAVDTALTSDAASGATTIAVGATTGFPLSYPYTLVIDPGEATQELVEVSNASGLTLTVTRHVDGTSAHDHSAGAVVQHDVSARDYAEPQAHIAATAAHGTTGDVVGTADTQTLTNKTVTLGANAVSGTKAQFNAACTDADFATLAGSETLTNKTLTSPAVNGGVLDATSTVDGVAASAIAGAWTTVTPTFPNVTSGAGHFAYRQVGKTIHVRGYFTAGTVGSTAPVTVAFGFTSTGAAFGTQFLVGTYTGGTLWTIAQGSSVVTTATNVTAGTSVVGSGFTGVIEVG